MQKQLLRIVHRKAVGRCEWGTLGWLQVFRCGFALRPRLTVLVKKNSWEAETEANGMRVWTGRFENAKNRSVAGLQIGH